MVVLQFDLKIGKSVDVRQVDYSLHWKYLWLDSDNRIRSWDELDKLRELPEFENTLLVGNPFYEVLKDDAKYYALKKLPNLKNIDGIIVQATFTKTAEGFPDVFPPPLK